MSETGRGPESREAVSAEARWKAHKQAIAASNDRARAAGTKQRSEREQRESDQRRADERREDLEAARKLNPTI